MDHRLPSHVTPEKYDIMLRPDLEAFTFYGEETITLQVARKTKEIVLHSAELAVLSAILHDGKTSQEAVITYDLEKERVTCTCPHDILPGEKKLQVTFNGILNDRMRGFYRSQYAIDGEKQYMAVTQLESTDARRVFPSFDEPAHKAIFTISLQIPKGHTAISNTIEEVVSEHESGYTLVKFVPTPKMSTYLLAVLVGKFEKIETKTPEGITVRVFTTPGKTHQAQFALDTAAKILSFYNSYFAFDYPLPVMDLIAVPDFDAGAMENWGAVTFRETALLVDPVKSSAANKQRVTLVIAHELAHMWFGNLVTMEWWTHLWLNEGFACYIEYLATNAIFPEWEIWDQFIVTEHNDALSLDGLANTHPIQVEVKHPSEIVEIFDQVSYAKGASVIHMLATYLGAEVFQKGLQVYLKKHAYANAKTEDLWEAFEQVSNKPVTKVMENWISKPGYPLLQVSSKEHALHLTQSRFFSSILSQKEHNDTTLWQVPLQLQTPETTQSILLSGKEDTVSLNNIWVKVNAGEASFVRVGYTHELLLSLQEPIAKKQLGTIDRLGVIRDGFDLAYAGYMPTIDALSLVGSYVNETEYVVWLEIASQMQKIAGLLAGNKAVHKPFHRFGEQLFTPIAHHMTWEKTPGESQTQTLLRAVALQLAGSYGNKKIVTNAQELFADFVANKTPIDSDIRGVVYTLVAQNGSMDEFEIFTKLYAEEELHQEKDRIARAITAFEDSAVIAKIFPWLLSDAVRAQDKTRFIYVLFLNPFARSQAWEFVQEHWEYFYKQFKGSHGMSRLVEGAGELTTQKEAENIVAFFKKHQAPEVARTVEQVKETILSRAAWIAREEASLAAFLKTV